MMVDIDQTLDVRICHGPNMDTLALPCQGGISIQSLRNKKKLLDKKTGIKQNI